MPDPVPRSHHRCDIDNDPPQLHPRRALHTSRRRCSSSAPHGALPGRELSMPHYARSAPTDESVRCLMHRAGHRTTCGIPASHIVLLLERMLEESERTSLDDVGITRAQRASFDAEACRISRIEPQEPMSVAQLCRDAKLHGLVMSVHEHQEVAVDEQLATLVFFLQ